jgi:hypothetical protein
VLVVDTESYSAAHHSALAPDVFTRRSTTGVLAATSRRNSSELPTPMRHLDDLGRTAEFNVGSGFTAA